MADTLVLLLDTMVGNTVTKGLLCILLSLLSAQDGPISRKKRGRNFKDCTFALETLKEKGKSLLAMCNMCRSVDVAYVTVREHDLHDQGKHRRLAPL